MPAQREVREFMRRRQTVARLEAPAGVYASIPCWTQDAWVDVVKRAVGRYYLVLIRDRLDAGIARDTVVSIARAMAGFAEGRTGRHCRPTVATLCQITGASRRVVQRARRVLELLGLARIVVDGRLRTRAERLKSWELGDRSRGWATEYALSIPPGLSDLQPGERGTPSRRANGNQKTTGKSLSTGRKSSVKSIAPKSSTTTATAFGRALRLAHVWATHPEAPDCVIEDPRQLAGALVSAVNAGWGLDDLLEAVRAQQQSSGLRVNPSNPGGWLRWLIAENATLPTLARRQRAEERRAQRQAAQAAREAENARIERHRASPERRAEFRARITARVDQAKRHHAREVTQPSPTAGDAPQPRRRSRVRVAGSWRDVVQRRNARKAGDHEL